MHYGPYLAALVVILLGVGCGDSKTPSTPEPPSSASAPAQGDLVRGGLLYDKFWKASTAAEPTETHPLWSQRPDQEANKRSGSTTWRCKECHGWDYKGVDGAYAKGSHRTGFPGILGSKLSQEEILTSLADAHGYRKAGLSDKLLQHLATFVREGLVDTSKWIDEQGAFRGDAKRGQTLYQRGLAGNKACQVCHGADGLKAPKGAPADYESFVGTISNENPVEFLHKVRFGHPGSKMPAAARSKASLQDIADLAAFAQTLPKAR